MKNKITTISRHMLERRDRYSELKPVIAHMHSVGFEPLPHQELHDVYICRVEFKGKVYRFMLKRLGVVNGVMTWSMLTAYINYTATEAKQNNNFKPKEPKSKAYYRRIKKNQKGN